MREAAGGTVLWCMRETVSGGTSGKRPGRSKAAWLESVQRWRRSGQTAGHYAQPHGLHAGTLEVWGTELRKELPAATKAAVTGFLPVGMVGAPPRIDAPRESAKLKVMLRNGRHVVVRGDVGSDTLQRLLDLAEGGAAC